MYVSRLGLYPSLQFTLAIYTLPASRQRDGKKGSICRPLAFCLNSSWLGFSAWYRMDRRGWGPPEEAGGCVCIRMERWWTAEPGKRQWHKDWFFIFMTATPQRESEGIGRGELKDAKWELRWRRQKDPCSFREHHAHIRHDWWQRDVIKVPLSDINIR